MTAFRFTIVIPTYQRRDVVLSSVRTLSRQEGCEPFEVVVVVDGSSDGSAAALRELQLPFPLTVIEQSNRGRAAACNRGATVGRGELLLILDDDMEADPRLLAEHDRSHRTGADVVLGHIPVHPDSRPGFLTAELAKWAEERRRSLVERGGKLELTDLLTGQMSVPRQVFLRLGGFDTNFTRDGRFGGEDYDLGLRLASAGYEIAFNPDAISWQRYVVSPRYYLRQWRGFGRGRVLLARKHPETAAVLLSRHERRTDRFFWRWFRWPLRQLVLVLLRVAPTRPRPYLWFYRVQDLQCFSGVRAAGGVPRQRPVRVLCYHSISDLRGAGEWEPFGVQPRRFGRQIAFLAGHFRFIDSQEFRRWLEGGGVPRRAVLLTFDDGLKDLRDAGLPILCKAHVPSLAFVVTRLLGRTNEWSAQPGDKALLPLLGAEELRALTKADVAIGAHSRTHPMLDGLSPAEAADEIGGSMADLEALSFERPAFFAYPYGAYNLETKRLAAAAGFAGAFTTKLALARAGCDPYEIPRIEILRDDRGLRFVWKVITAGRVRK